MLTFIAIDIYFNIWSLFQLKIVIFPLTLTFIAIDTYVHIWRLFQLKIVKFPLTKNYVDTFLTKKCVEIS